MVEVIFKPFLEERSKHPQWQRVRRNGCFCRIGFQVRCIFSPTSWCNAWVLHNFAIIFLFFILFLCKFQVISQQAEQEQAELEVKTTKHEIFKVTLSLHTQLNNTELKPITVLGNEHCDKNIIPPLVTFWTSLECK